jgi:anti-anti-sigma factor
VLGELRVQARTTTVVLHGELDLVTVEGLRVLLANAVRESPEKLVIDVSDVGFVDVLSLSTILATADAVRDRGGHAQVRGASAAIRRVCALLNADDVLVPELPLQRQSVR